MWKEVNIIRDGVESGEIVQEFFLLEQRGRPRVNISYGCPVT